MSWPTAHEIGTAQRESLARYVEARRAWKSVPAWEAVAKTLGVPAADSSPLAPLVHANLVINAYQWDLEDLARAPDVTDAELADVKRRIDASNLRRTESFERIDGRLVEALAEEGVRPAPDAPLHSETPGAVVDRLAVLALRLHHTREDEGRTALVREQESDLRGCLEALLEELRAGRKRLKRYRTLKSYVARRS